jgi:hypothetical protein
MPWEDMRLSFERLGGAAQFAHHVLPAAWLWLQDDARLVGRCEQLSLRVSVLSAHFIFSLVSLLEETYTKPAHPFQLSICLPV